jgi:hypothetical protein
MLELSIKFIPSIHFTEFTMFPSLPDAEHQARLHDLAKAEAARLRGEAIDDFWRGADVAWRRSLGAMAQRSATRLRARLDRRARGGSSGLPSGV